MIFEDDENDDEMFSDAYELAELWSNNTGKNILAGVEDGEVWIASNRTSGREYFESIYDAEDRLKNLYWDIRPDDNDNFMEDF